MKTVKDILEAKGRNVWSIAPDSPVFEAVGLMAEKDIGALVVVDGENIVGIVSERDYARKVVLMGKSSKDIPVRDIMTPNVIHVRPDQSIEECMTIMSGKRIRHLPVLEADKLAGVISIGDVVKAIIANDKFLIEQLENYIKGGR